MRYEMVGTQEIRLSDGQTISPTVGEFEADLEQSEEEFLVKIGAICRLEE